MFGAQPFSFGGAAPAPATNPFGAAFGAPPAAAPAPASSFTGFSFGGAAPAPAAPPPAANLFSFGAPPAAAPAPAAAAPFGGFGGFGAAAPAPAPAFGGFSFVGGAAPAAAPVAAAPAAAVDKQDAAIGAAVGVLNKYLAGDASGPLAEMRQLLRMMYKGEPATNRFKVGGGRASACNRHAATVAAFPERQACYARRLTQS